MLLLAPCSSAGFVMNGFAHSPFHQLNYHVWHGARSCTSSNRCNVHINTKKLRSSHRPLNYHIWQYYHFWIFFSCAKLSFLDLVLSHDLKSTEASNSSCAPFMGQFVWRLSIYKKKRYFISSTAPQALAAAHFTTKKDTPSQNLPLLQQLIIPTTKIDERMMV